MRLVPRLQDHVLRQHFQNYRQMAFVSGPRQVGKTTTCRALTPGLVYLNWDDQDDRRLITQGPARVAQHIGVDALSEQRQVVVFDEIHKYARWKTFLKGLFDRHADRLGILVTGSSRLDAYRRGGDSLMGRYFIYRMHALSVGELVNRQRTEELIRPPQPLASGRFDALWSWGGFPEPFIQRSARFSNRWQRLRRQQLVREDVRDLTRIQELGQLEILVALLCERSGDQLSYSSLARQVNVSVDTMRRWVRALCVLHHGFLVRPWFRNVAKSLRKEPKFFLYDWSGVKDPGKRAETFFACHLLKAVETWTDVGLGEFSLHYLRDKLKREVDFLVVRDDQPWILIEVKQSETQLSRALPHFQKQVKAPYAVQAVMDLPFVRASCFDRNEPTVVPARTLLSQLP